MSSDLERIHQGQPVLHAGAKLEEAKAVMIMIHGRGASAQDIIGLSQDLSEPNIAYVAPQAYGNQWYPYPFMQPIASNEPYLSSALARVGELVAQVGEAGIPAERVLLLGFSQGACLASEYTARNAKRYGGLIVFSGGLIGPDGTPRDYPGSLDGTPVFIGCSDVDGHIPKARVQLTAEVLRKLGGDVTERFYPGMGHTINDDEINEARKIMRTMLQVE